MDIETHTNTPPKGYWIISGLALVWNLLGVGAYLTEAMASPAQLVEMFGQAQADIVMAQPAWYTGVFAIAVFGGALGCIGLLLRQKWALWAFVASLIAVFLQQVYLYAMTDAASTISGAGWIMPILIPLVAIGLVLFTRRAIANGWMK